MTPEHAEVNERLAENKAKNVKNHLLL